MIEPQEVKKKAPSDGAILGYNLLVFAAYTGLCMLSGSDGAFGAFLISLVHFVVCGIVGAVKSRWAWLLAGLIVVVIGFGTCVSNFHLDTR